MGKVLTTGSSSIPLSLFSLWGAAFSFPIDPFALPPLPHLCASAHLSPIYTRQGALLSLPLSLLWWSSMMVSSSSARRWKAPLPLLRPICGLFSNSRASTPCTAASLGGFDCGGGIHLFGLQWDREERGGRVGGCVDSLSPLLLSFHSIPLPPVSSSLRPLCV